jgi:lysophospholipase L1-like esterase
LSYVAIGASDAAGFGAPSPPQAWPALFRAAALPRDSAYRNVAVPATTTERAFRLELPAALAARPDVVTVWLAVDDILGGVPADDYARALGRLVHQLRAAPGRPVVLVGNTPDLRQLPAYLACRPGGTTRTAPPCLYFGGAPDPAGLDRIVRAYDAAAADVARREGAVLVDLAAVLRAAAPGGDPSSLLAGDGLHPNAAGHRLLAGAFAAAYRTAVRLDRTR